MLSADVVGAPEARAQELIDTVTSSVYLHVSTFLSAKHRDVLAFLLALERLRATHKLTDSEMSLWTGDVDLGNVLSRRQSASDVHPHWLTSEVVFQHYSLYLS